MADRLLDDLLYSPAAAAALAQARRHLRGGVVEVEAVDRIGQTHKGPSKWLPSQAAAYLRIFTGLTSGEFAQVLVPLGTAPNLDSERQANQAALDGLHSTFRATVDTAQDHADADGQVSWSIPITVDQSTGVGLPEAAGVRPGTRPVSVPSGGVPLEIGYTMPSRTLHHLLVSGGVARWPYHHEHLCLFVNLQPGSSRARQARQEVSAS
ncbi:hypothetical protein [Streptomyces virginiae]|uniref:hypothetical protein n=1 Tax=Streptomyces virginiae TaxID=1961 RepID=UPI0037B26ACA